VAGLFFVLMKWKWLSTGSVDEVAEHVFVLVLRQGGDMGGNLYGG
jgi:hypothetical protein